MTKVWKSRQATDAPRAIFKSHFTLLRVKRPDTALREEKEGGSERKRGRHCYSREGRNVTNGRKTMGKKWRSCTWGRRIMAPGTELPTVRQT